MPIKTSTSQGLEVTVFECFLFWRHVSLQSICTTFKCCIKWHIDSSTNTHLRCRPTASVHWAFFDFKIDF